MKSTASPSYPEKPWSLSIREVEEAFKTSGEGLKEADAGNRRRRYGPNRLKALRKKSAWAVFLDQFKNFIVLLLAVAAALSFAFGQWLEGVAIVAVIIINAAIGFFTELRAVRSMESLKRLSRVSAKVRRNGRLIEISAENLVPGDVVLVEGGDIITADLRLTEASRLRADESALTGESLPAGKSAARLEGDVPLADRRNMLFKGTAVTEGSGEGVVVATGMDTELGRISSLAQEAEEELSPLERRLNRLGHRLIWVTVAIALVVAVTGILAGKDLLLIIETAIALAVAAIPEGLPIVATIALARGMWRMAGLNALINRLSAVETLGTTNVICVDKTGTLTENRMTATRFALAAEAPGEIEEVEVTQEGGKDSRGFMLHGEPLDPQEREALGEAIRVGVLCNNAGLDGDSPRAEESAVGDPLEIALLAAGLRAGVRRDELLETLPEVKEEAFDPEVNMMATLHGKDGGFLVAVKGAPESVIGACSSIKTPGGLQDMSRDVSRRWLDFNRKMAAEGLRVLGLAEKEVEDSRAHPYDNLVFLGFVGLLDPPRREVDRAIASCKDAGIRVIMVTGDQPVTARSIGLKVGLIEDEDAQVVHGKDLRSPEDMSEEEQTRLLGAGIFTRISPEQKLDIITLHQKNGSVVAMTGDGVNDAPALKKADIGVAMGRRGTQVAQEAADMVLRDDSFGTIVVAVQQGRAIFDNIRKFILFLLSGNAAEIMIVAFALLAGAALPILPLQILYLNMIGDVFPALALGVGKGDPAKMNHPPRHPGEPVLTRGHWLAIGGWGLILALSVLGAFAAALGPMQLEGGRAVTLSFLTLAFARLWHVFNMRDPDSALIKNDVTRNPFIWGALGLCVGLLLMAVYLPGLSLVLRLVPPDAAGWGLILGMSLLPLVVGQALKSRLTVETRSRRR